MAQHQKHENQMRDLQLQCEANVRELHQLQVRYGRWRRSWGQWAAQGAGFEKTIATKVDCTYLLKMLGLKGFVSCIDPNRDQFSIMDTGLDFL